MLRHEHASRTWRRVARPTAGAVPALLVAALLVPTLLVIGLGSARASQGTPPAGPGHEALAATPAASGPGAMTSASLRDAVGRDKAAQIEAHIARLRGILGITPAQEPLWQGFAAVMRQNVVQMDAVYARRQSAYGSMNAVQDLASYGEAEETNARNVQQLLPPFRALYDSLSPEQKKTADTALLRYTNKAVKKPG